jgi:hypothetical protein
MRPLLALLLLLSTPPNDREGAWRSDLASLLEQLQQTHPRFAACGLPSEITAAATSLGERADALSDARIAVEVQRILAMAGDGHTLLWPVGMKRLPLALWWFDDGVYVVEGEHTGKRVAAIGGQLPEEVFRRLTPYVSVDNAMQFRWAVAFYATLPDFLEAAGIEPHVRFTDGSSPTLTPQPLDLGSLELRLVPPARRGETFAMREVAPGVLYVAVNSMSGELPAFAEELGKRLAGYDRAILDLRLNTGGDASNADALMKTLIAFDVRGGKLVTLVSRMTFSAAQTFASRLDQWTATRFAGESTGSSPNHYGNERPFRLPQSGLRGSISSGWNQPVTSRDKRQTITPEIEVPQRAADYFGGNDPTLAAAITALTAPAPEAR